MRGWSHSILPAACTLQLHVRSTDASSDMMYLASATTSDLATVASTSYRLMQHVVEEHLKERKPQDVSDVPSGSEPSFLSPINLTWYRQTERFSSARPRNTALLQSKSQLLTVEDALASDEPKIKNGAKVLDGCSLTTDCIEMTNNGQKKFIQGWMIIVLLLLSILPKFLVAWWAGRGIPALTEENQSQRERYKEWSDTPLSCFNDPFICIQSCCCPCVTYGQNAQNIGCRPFDTFLKGCCGFVWIIVVAELAGTGLGALLGGGLGIGNFFGTLATVLLIHALRLQLRARYQFHEPDEDTANTCMVICCPQLAIAQEARHIQNSTKAGYELPLAGPPIGVRGLLRPQPEIVPFSGAAHRLGGDTSNHPTDTRDHPSSDAPRASIQVTGTGDGSNGAASPDGVDPPPEPAKQADEATSPH